MEYYISAKLIYYYEPTYDTASIAGFNKAMSAYISSILKRNFEINKNTNLTPHVELVEREPRSQPC